MMGPFTLHLGDMLLKILVYSFALWIVLRFLRRLTVAWLGASAAGTEARSNSGDHVSGKGVRFVEIEEAEFTEIEDKR